MYRLPTWFQFTLPRGERQAVVWFICKVFGFNSRSRVGSDPEASQLLGPDSQFQFTLPRGERHKLPALIALGKEFQFTLPRGERLNPGRRRPRRPPVSIHAPAWGATDVYAGSAQKYAGFNSRSRVGSDMGLESVRS